MQLIQKPTNREAVAVVGECLKILMLLETLSKATECQKGLMNLLLETIVLVFSTLEDDLSQDVNDLRNTTIRLVSQLAQIPKSATCFKDVLLAMPVVRREELQGMIRSSVMQDQKSMQTKSVAPPLLIKLPAQAQESREKSLSPSTPTEQLENNSEEEEEDDWDAFQSFPASKNEVAPTIKEEVVKSFSYSDFSTPNNEIDNDSKEIMDVDQQAVERENLSSVGGNHQSKELHGSEDSNHDSEERDDYQQEGDEAMTSNRIDDAFLDTQSVEVAEGYCEPSDNLHEERAKQTPNSDIAEGSSESSDDQHEGIAGQMPSLEIAEGYKEPSNNHHVEIAGQMSDLQSGEHAEGSI